MQRWNDLETFIIISFPYQQSMKISDSNAIQYEMTATIFKGCSDGVSLKIEFEFIELVLSVDFKFV